MGSAATAAVASLAARPVATEEGSAACRLMAACTAWVYTGSRSAVIAAMAALYSATSSAWRPRVWLCLLLHGLLRDGSCSLLRPCRGGRGTLLVLAAPIAAVASQIRSGSIPCLPVIIATAAAIVVAC